MSRFVWADGTGSEESSVKTVLTRLGLRVPDILTERLRSADSRIPLDAPAYMVQAGNLYRIATDHIGTPRLVVNVATGAVAERFDVDEWGRVAGDTSPGFQPLGFAAGLYDPDSGLVRFSARDYEPETGRWTTKDPLRSLNRYAYRGDDPVNGADRSGLCPTDDLCAACAACWKASSVAVARCIALSLGEGAGACNAIRLGCVPICALCGLAPSCDPPPSPPPPGPQCGAEGTGSLGGSGGASGGGQGF